MRYRFAFTADERLVPIESLASRDRVRSEKYLCFGCDRELIPVLGKVREHHFRHKADGEVPCAPETYLHALAKHAFFRGYQAAIEEGRPFTLAIPTRRICHKWEERLGHTCERDTGKTQFDLTAYFDEVALEEGVKGFVADVLLSSSRTGERLLVEIAVTHWCEPEKIATGLRILELTVQFEDDIPDFSEGVDATSPLVTLHNFKDQPPIEVACDRNCDAELAMFIVYRSGKSILVSDHPATIWGMKRKPSVAYSHLVTEIEHGLAMPYLAGDGYRLEAEKAFKNGAAIKCCSLCRYAGFRTWEKPVFCKIKKEEVGVNEAASCEAYRPGVRN